jgi:spore germination protein GerM
MKKRTLIFLSILVFTFLFSFTWYLIENWNVERRVLFFPRDLDLELVSEVRNLKKADNKEQKIEQMILELILGPVELRHAPLFPIDTKLVSILLRDSQVYLNFSEDLSVGLLSFRLSLDDIVDGIVKNIRFSFKSIDKVILSIDGIVAREIEL